MEDNDNKGFGCFFHVYALVATLGFIYGLQYDLSHAVAIGFIAGSLWMFLFGVAFMWVNGKGDDDELHV